MPHATSNAVRACCSASLARIGHQLRDVVGIVGRGMRHAGRGASEHQAAHARRVPERELLRNHAAHRDAVDVRAVDLRMIEDRRDVIRHIGHGPRCIGLVALAGAAIVDEDSFEAPLDEVEKRITPSAAGAAEAHDEGERIAAAADFVPKFESVFGLRKISGGCHEHSVAEGFVIGVTIPRWEKIDRART